VWKGGEHAAIRYRRGNISSTTVNGKDAPERVPEVLTWPTGDYQIVLPPLVLPSLPAAPPPPAPMAGATATVRAPPPAVEATATIRATAAAPDPTATVRVPAPGMTPATTSAPVPGRPARQAQRRATLMGLTGPASRPAAEPEDPDPDARDTRPMIPAVRGHGTNPGMPVAVFDPQLPERTTDVGLPTVDDFPAAPARPAPAPGRTESFSALAAPSPVTERGRAALPVPAPGAVPTGLLPAAPAEAKAGEAAAARTEIMAPVIESSSDSPATVRAPLTARGMAALSHPPPPAARPPPASQRAAPGHTPDSFAPPLAPPRGPRAQPPRAIPRRTALRREPVFERPVVFHVAVGLGIGLAVVAGYWAMLALLG